MQTANANRVQLGGFTHAKRQRVLSEHKGLPRAVRVPPERSATIYILARMSNVDKVREWLDDATNEDVLRREKRAFYTRIRTEWDGPTASIEKRAHQTFCGRAEQPYSVESCLARLRAVSNQKPTKDDVPAFDRICASEYLDEDQPGPFWQLRLLQALVMIIDHSGAKGILAARDTDNSQCAVCLETIHDQGDASEWMQLEPCRHWLCSRCGEEHIVREGATRCHLCRKPIVSASYAFHLDPRS